MNLGKIFFFFRNPRSILDDHKLIDYNYSLYLLFIYFFLFRGFHLWLLGIFWSFQNWWWRIFIIFSPFWMDGWISLEYILDVFCSNFIINLEQKTLPRPSNPNIETIIATVNIPDCLNSNYGLIFSKWNNSILRFPGLFQKLSLLNLNFEFFILNSQLTLRYAKSYTWIGIFNFELKSSNYSNRIGKGRKKKSHYLYRIFLRFFFLVLPSQSLEPSAFQ